MTISTKSNAHFVFNEKVNELFTQEVIGHLLSGQNKNKKVFKNPYHFHLYIDCRWRYPKLTDVEIHVQCCAMYTLEKIYGILILEIKTE